MSGRAVKGRSLIHMFEHHVNRVDQNFAYILEIHRHPRVHHRLHLSQPPIRPRRVPHELSWLEFRHELIPCPGGKIRKMPFVPGLDPLTLGAALCARLCHDLAGSLGALTGTLELAAEENDREALDLALTISREIGARLRLLRAAWGTESDIPPLDTLLPGLSGCEKLTLDTKALTATAPDSLRLCLSLLMVAAAGLPRGGTIRLSGPDNRLLLDIEGPRAAWPEALSHCLAGNDALIEACGSPRLMAIALACLQARALGRSLCPGSDTSLAVTG